MRFGISSLRHKGPEKKVDKSYVSEFSNFINHFMEEHPEEMEEQLKGRALYWDHRAGTEAHEEDSVPDDRYGFDYSAWRATKKQGSSGNSR